MRCVIDFQLLTCSQKPVFLKYQFRDKAKNNLTSIRTSIKLRAKMCFENKLNDTSAIEEIDWNHCVNNFVVGWSVLKYLQLLFWNWYGCKIKIAQFLKLSVKTNFPCFKAKNLAKVRLKAV